MKLGLCTDFENLAIAAKAGFDYVECGLSKLAAMPREEYEALLEKKAAFPVPVTKANLFLPREVKPLGPDACEKVQREYLEPAFSRANAVGIKLVVFGSSGARNVPEGWSTARAWRQLADFLELVAEYAEKYDIVLALEPLRTGESNILNYVTEGTALCGIVNHPRITVLGDTYHMILGGEPWEHLTRAGEKLSHMHIGHTLKETKGRIFPARGDGEDYSEVLNVLKNMGYKGDVSIEAGFSDLEKDAVEAAACLRPLL